MLYACYMAYLLHKMFTYGDDRTYSFDYQLEEKDTMKPLNFSDSGVIQYHEVQQYDSEGFLQPLKYDETAKRYIKMVYQEKNTDWNKEDPRDWDTYSNEQEAVSCTQDNFRDAH